MDALNHPIAAAPAALDKTSFTSSSVNTPPISKAIALGSKIISGAVNDSGGVKACIRFAELVQNLVSLLKRVLEVNEIQTNEDVQNTFEGLPYLLNASMELIEDTRSMGYVYRTISASHINSEFRKHSNALGDAMHGLKMVLNNMISANISGVLEDVKKLEAKFCNIRFQLNRKEAHLYKEGRHITDKMYHGLLPTNTGIVELRNVVERYLGPDKLKEEWKSIADHLFRDIDRTREEKDSMEEHHLMQTFRAIAPPGTADPDFICPLTLECMDDPVTLVGSSVTYDRKSIEGWLYAHGLSICPVTKTELNTALGVPYIPNKPLKSLIEDWKRSKRNFKHRSASRNGYRVKMQSAGRTTPALPQSRDNVRKFNSYAGGAISEEAPMITDNFFEAPISTNIFYNEQVAGHEGEEITSVNAVTEGWKDKPTLTAPTVQPRRQPHWEISQQILKFCSEGEIGYLKPLANEGWNLEEPRESGKNGLHFAAQHGNEAVVQFLLDQGLDIDAVTDMDYQTPLYLATRSHHLHIVRVLLERGANVMIVDKHGWSPLHVAASDGLTEVVSDILTHIKKEDLRAYLSLATQAGWNALHLAVSSTNPTTVQLLLPYFADNLNLGDPSGYTALHAAVTHSLQDIVEMLLDAHAHVNAQTKDGWTPLHFAQEKDNMPIGRLLLQHGADPDLAGKHNVTPLHRAATQNHMDFAKMLVKLGNASLSIKTMPADNLGKKAAAIAHENKHYKLEKYLLKKNMQRLFTINLQW